MDSEQLSIEEELELNWQRLNQATNAAVLRDSLQESQRLQEQE